MKDVKGMTGQGLVTEARSINEQIEYILRYLGLPEDVIEEHMALTRDILGDPQIPEEA